MVTSPYEWNILEWDEKLHTTNQLQAWTSTKLIIVLPQGTDWSKYQTFSIQGPFQNIFKYPTVHPAYISRDPGINKGVQLSTLLHSL